MGGTGQYQAGFIYLLTVCLGRDYLHSKVLILHVSSVLFMILLPLGLKQSVTVDFFTEA